MTTDSAEAVEASEDEVLNHLEHVRDGSSEFAVIEPEPESENDFFQTSTWTEGVVLGKSYVAEIRMPSAEGFRQLRLRTKKFDEVVGAAERYIHGDTPDSLRWEDVTDEFSERSRLFSEDVIVPRQRSVHLLDVGVLESHGVVGDRMGEDYPCTCTGGEHLRYGGPCSGVDVIYVLAAGLGGSSVGRVCAHGIHVPESLGDVADIERLEIRQFQIVEHHVLPASRDHLGVEVRCYGAHAHLGSLDDYASCSAERVQDGSSALHAGQIDQCTGVLGVERDG